MGGPTVNELTLSLSARLPLQYIQINGEDKFYSRLTKKIYDGSNCSLVQAIKSPFSKDKVIVCLFGLDRFDTDRSVQVLIDLFNKRRCEKQLKNMKAIWCPAKLIRKNDDNDADYEFLE